MPRMIKVEANGTLMDAELENNTSADALLKLLQGGPLAIRMEDYAGMEKVGDIGTGLPRNDRSQTVGPCDIILYLGSNLVIYYGTNSWNFTKMGRIVGVPDIRKVLGEGDVTVTLSLP